MTKAIAQNQINRLAKIYISKPVSAANFEFHHRVLNLQVAAIKTKKSLKK